jgi:hypothetical protein
MRRSSRAVNVREPQLRAALASLQPRDDRLPRKRSSS